MRHQGLPFMAAVVAAGVACSESTDYGGAGGGGGGGRSVSVGAGAFSPSNLSVTTGSVTWTWNSGAVTHNVTFEDGTDNSGDRASGTHSRTFSTAGSYRYRCTIHSTSFTSGMIGQVAVSSGGSGGGNPYP